MCREECQAAVGALRSQGASAPPPARKGSAPQESIITLTTAERDAASAGLEPPLLAIKFRDYQPHTNADIAGATPLRPRLPVVRRPPCPSRRAASPAMP